MTTIGGPALVLVSTLLAFAAGWGLSGWARRVCDTSSRWLQRWVVGAASGLFAGSAIVPAASWWEVAPFWLVGMATGLLVTCDLAVMRLPDPIMAVAYPAFLLPLVLAAAAEGEWASLGRAALAGSVLLLFYLASALVRPGGIFLGDVKYAGILGAWLGWFGWVQVVWGTLFAALLGGVVGIAIILSRRGSRTTEFPYGPMMAVGAWLGVLTIS